MKVNHDKCFLCRKKIGGRNTATPSSRSKKVEFHPPKEANGQDLTVRVLLLVKYLLTCKWSKYDGLIDGIKGLLQQSDGSPYPYSHKEEDGMDGTSAKAIQFCGNCDSQLGIVSDLHQQLEVVQMKLVNVLKSVQTMVIKSSRMKDGYAGSSKSGPSFPREGVDSDPKSFNADYTTIDGKQVLHDFQEGVINKAKDSVEIPRVFLDKFTDTRLQPVVMTMTDSTAIVKTEQLDLDEYIDNLSPSSIGPPADDDADWFDDSMPPPKSKIRKRKKKTVKTNVEGDEHAPPKKARRSPSATTAKKNSGEKKPRKPRRRKNKDLDQQQEATRNPPEAFKLMEHSVKKKGSFKPEQYWACAICSYTTEKQYSFEHHLRTHENSISKTTPTTTTTEDTTISSSSSPADDDTTYHCEKCPDATFSIKQNYQYHLACHNGEILNTCEVCNEPCQPLTFLDHMKSHSLEKLFPCLNCSHCSSTRENYLGHLNFHVNSAKHKCDICDLVYLSRQLLLSHYYKEHQIGEKFFCDVEGCTRWYFENSQLQRHKTCYHATSRPKYFCQHCGKTLAHASSFELHLLQHTKVKPVPCDECSQSFIAKEALKRHKVSHHGAPKEKCEYCGKEYSEYSSLRRHLAQVHTGSDFVCDFEQCGKAFGTKYLLKRHMAIHSDERKFECEECGARFKIKQDVKIHSRIHSGEKRYKCQYCDKAFIHKMVLKTHMNLHTGEEPYVCEDCGRSFGNPSNLHSHKRNCHSNEPAIISPRTGLPTKKYKLYEKRKRNPVFVKVELGDDGQQPQEVASEMSSVSIPMSLEGPNDSSLY